MATARGRRPAWPGRWPVLALVVLLLAGIAVLVQVAGPAEFGAPRTALLDVEQPFPADGADGNGPVEQTETLEQEPRGLPGWTVVVWLTAVLAALVLVVRWVVAFLRPDPDGTDGTVDEPVSGLAADDLLVLQAVRRGVRDAGAALDAAAAQEAERDVVVRCWLALETAAQRAGTLRAAAQTPTEFTAALLQTHRADQDATAELLGLYHRARFGRSALPPGSVTAARDALDRIAASLDGPQDALAPQSTEGSRG